MRAAEEEGGGPYSAPLIPGGSETRSRHFPPLALVQADGNFIAIEFELATKRARPLLVVLKAYRRAAHFASIVYYCDVPRVRRRIERLARELHIDDRVIVKPWEAC